MDRISRKKLKEDEFAAEVTHTVDYLSEHRTEVVRYLIIGVVVIAVVAGWLTWRSHQGVLARAALNDAIETRQGAVGPPRPDGLIKMFPTAEAKDKAAIAAFSDVAAKYSGRNEGTIAQYYLGTIAVEQGNLSGAEKAFQEVIDNGGSGYAALAKISLAQVYKSEGKTADGEKLLRSLADGKATEFVSKEQATLELARYIAPTKPAEARKLLEPLVRLQRNAVSRAAMSELANLAPQQ